jgi:hypothetical protein
MHNSGTLPQVTFVPNGEILKVRGSELMSLPTFKLMTVPSLSKFLDM